MTAVGSNVTGGCDGPSVYGLTEHQYYVIWNAVYAVIIVPTVVGNGLILTSIWRYRGLRSKLHLLIGNLALQDLMVGAVLLPLDTAITFTAHDRDKYTCLGKMFVFTWTLGGSCYGLLLISIERFIAVVFPLRYIYITKRKLVVAILFGWGYVSVIAALPMFGCNNFPTGESAPCHTGIAWGAWCRLVRHVNLVLAMTVNIIMYIVVVRIAVRKSKCISVPGVNIARPKSRDISKTKTMATVLGTFVLFWGPYSCLTVWNDVLNPDTECNGMVYYVRRWTLLLGVCNSAVNWAIYGLCNNDFRQAFKAIVTCRSGVVIRQRSRVSAIY